VQSSADGAPHPHAAREQIRRTIVLRRLLQYHLGVAALGFATAWLLPGGVGVYLIIYAIFTALTLAALASTRRAALRAASACVLLSMFLPITLATALLGGVESRATMAYPLLIFVAGLIASLRVAIVTALVSSLAILGIALAEAHALLPPAPMGRPLDAWVSFSMIAVAALAVLDVALRGIRGSIDDAEASARALRESIEQSPDGVLAVDDELCVTGINRAGEQLFGRARDTLIGASLLDAAWLEPEERPRLRELLTSARIDAPSEPREFSISRPDGSTAMAEINARRVEHERSGPAIQLVLRDMTARHRLEHEMRALELERQHAQRLEAIGRLAGGIAHDFNNYLTVIVGSCELLEQQLESDRDAASAVRDITSAAMHSARLTRQLLAFSRRQTLEPRAICANALITRLQPLLQRLLGEQVRIRALGNASPSVVVVDPSQIEVALINLAVNARDAMPHGGDLTLESDRVALERDAAAALGLAPGPYVRIAVSDTGSGIDPTIKDHIFEPFFTTKSHAEGTGIGLATVYGIVAQSGGAIRVESEPGRGARFEILLPARDDRSVEAPDALQQRSAAAQQGRILLVEDEAPVRQVVSAMLASQGYRVVEAEHGRAALEIIRAGDQRFDAVLSDVVMPELSGPELRDQLARLAPGLPVVLMSGYPEDQLGPADTPPKQPILGKPFDRERLVAALDAAIDRARREPPATGDGSAGAR